MKFEDHDGVIKKYDGVGMRCGFEILRWRNLMREFGGCYQKI
jgi:hypothetical protein